MGSQDLSQQWFRIRNYIYLLVLQNTQRFVSAGKKKKKRRSKTPLTSPNIDNQVWSVVIAILQSGN